MSESSGVHAALTGPWYRILTVPAPVRASSAEWDFVSMLPAMLSAAQRGGQFVVAWLSRGGGAPLELITNAGPVAFAAEGAFASGNTMLFPHGARGAAIGDGWLTAANRLLWTPCLGRQAPPLGEPGTPRRTAEDAREPTMFESALVTLMARPFGWLVVATPTDLLDAEAAALRTQLSAMRRFEEERARLDVARAERRIAELDAFREAGLWSVRVLAGAATAAELHLLAPVLVGSADLGHHPYRLRSGLEARSLAAALMAEAADGDEAQVPFPATAGVLAVLAGLPRREVPGIRVVDAGYFDVTSETDERAAGGASGAAASGANQRAGVSPVLNAGMGVGIGQATDGLGPARRQVVSTGAAAHGDVGQPMAASVGHAATAHAAAGQAATAVTAHAAAGQAATAVTAHAAAGPAAAGPAAVGHGDAGHGDAGHGAAWPRSPEPQSIDIGTIMDGQDRPVGMLRVPLATLNRHVFVTGSTGSGKSQTVRHLLERLTHLGLPWLVIEPAKSEYAAMAGRVEGIAQVTVINPADNQAVPLSVNPLAPEPGYPVQAHIDMVRALFQAAFDAEEPFPQIMSQALQRVYEANGWDVVTGRGVPGALAPPAVPTLEQLQRAALGVIEDVGYGKELGADVRGFVDVRLRSLRVGSAGRFFEGGHPADIGELLRRNVVLAIEDVANDEDKAFLMGTLIIRIVEHLRLRARRHKADGLRHVIVIEEAHRLLRNRGQQRASSHAVELFAGLLAEIRAYGEGIVVAEQIPAKLVPDVVKNTALKVVHRLPAHDDRQLVGAAMNLDDEQSRQVVSLAPGVAAVFADGMDRPLRICVPLGERRERVLPGAPPPVRGRRSAACGPSCAGGRPCSLFELRRAELLAVSPQDAWLRVWSQTLVLAFVAGRELPAVPEPLRRRWAGLETDPRLRECVLATVVERAVACRAGSLRESYDPGRLTRCAADTALRILGGVGDLAGTSAGPTWVIPQLRWLHEAEQALAARASQHAPALTYDLPGLADGPGITVAQRLEQLAAHPLSIELERNQRLTWDALLGGDVQAGFRLDVAAVMVGMDSGVHLAAAADAMKAGWLPEVLSWPGRYAPATGGEAAVLPAQAGWAQPATAGSWRKRALLGAGPRPLRRPGARGAPGPAAGGGRYADR